MVDEDEDEAFVVVADSLIGFLRIEEVGFLSRTGKEIVERGLALLLTKELFLISDGNTRGGGRLGALVTEVAIKALVLFELLELLVFAFASPFAEGWFCC